MCLFVVSGGVFFWGFFFGFFSGREECRGFLLVFLDGVLIGVFLCGGVLSVIEGACAGGLVVCVGGVGMSWGFSVCPDVGK